MSFEVEINGRRRVVTIDAPVSASAAGGRFRVQMHDPSVGGHDPSRLALEVDVRATELGLSLLLGDDQRSVDVAVTERPNNEVLLQLPHVSVTAVVDGQRARQASAVPTIGEQRVTAPMPGRVIRVLVKAGDSVALRQGLVVVEAMKMENELTASRPGRVREVAIAEGSLVDAGRLLIVID